MSDDINVPHYFRPKIPARLGTLALVTRYDFMHTTIDGQWVFEGETFAEEQTGKSKSM